MMAGHWRTRRRLLMGLSGAIILLGILSRVGHLFDQYVRRADCRQAAGTKGRILCGIFYGLCEPNFYFYGVFS